MIADIEGIMAGRTCALKTRSRYRQVIQPSNACDRDRLIVEDLCPLRYQSPLLKIFGRALVQIEPSLIQGHRLGSKGYSTGISSQRVIDSEKEVLRGKVNRSAQSTYSVQRP